MSRKKRKTNQDNVIRKIDEAKIQLICKENNVDCYFAEGIIFLSTPFGKWHIPSTCVLRKQRIKLYHENYARTGWHLQDFKSKDIEETIRYISNHDYNKLKRENRIAKSIYEKPFVIIHHNKNSVK